MFFHHKLKGKKTKLKKRPKSAYIYTYKYIF